jgi:hypothetical protein
MTRTLAVLVIVTLTLGVSAPADVLDDDLALVRQAVKAEPPSAIEPKVEVEREEPADARWLRVRVQEKGAARPTVLVNLPLSLLRALTDEEPTDWLEHLRESGFQADGSGGDLVHIEDEETTVRVWLE